MIQVNKKIINNIKKAFTLTEVIIATFISTIILGFIFVFISDIGEGIIETKNETTIFTSFYEFNNKLNNYREIYLSGSILINSLGQNDVFLMTDYLGEDGVIIAPVNLSDNKIDITNDKYKNIGIGIKRVGKQEITEITADVSEIYDYVFFDNNIFSDLKVKNMFITSYNSGMIFNLDLFINIDFRSGLIDYYWEDLPNTSIRRFNIDF